MKEEKVRVQVFVSNSSRTGIGWQEIVGVLFGILGSLVYCLLAKQPANKKTIVFLLSLLFTLVSAAIGSQEQEPSFQADASPEVISESSGSVLPTSSNTPAPQFSSNAQSPASDASSTSIEQGRKFLGTSPIGYSLWFGSDDCIYVKNLTEVDLARLNVSLSDFKAVVKQQTGSSYIFFE